MDTALCGHLTVDWSAGAQGEHSRVHQGLVGRGRGWIKDEEAGDPLPEGGCQMKVRLTLQNHWVGSDFAT